MDGLFINFEVISAMGDTREQMEASKIVQTLQERTVCRDWLIAGDDICRFTHLQYHLFACLISSGPSRCTALLKCSGKLRQTDRQAYRKSIRILIKGLSKYFPNFVVPH